MGTGRSFDAVFNNLQSQSERRLDGMTVDSRVDKKGPGPRILARPKLAFLPDETSHTGNGNGYRVASLLL